MKDEEIIIEDGKIIEKRFQFYEKLRRKFKDYTGSKLGGKSNKITEYLFAIPDFFMLLCRLAVDSRVSATQKLFVGGIIAYVISPIDLIPDFIPVVGYVDDLVLVVYGLNIILNEVDRKILLDNWSGEEDLLNLLKSITAVSEEFLDKNILKKIRNIINKMKK